MRKQYRPLPIGLVNCVIDGNLIGNFLFFGGICGGSCPQKEAKRNTKNSGQNADKKNLLPLPAIEPQLHHALPGLAYQWFL
jgi:hypothetical protein